MVTMVIEKSPKSPKIFICDVCDVTCSHKGDWNKHVLTSKHANNLIMVTNGNIPTPKNPEIINTCECGKKYKYISGLSRHKKTCNNEKENEKGKENEKEKDVEEEIMSDKKLILELLKSNNELQKQMIELCKEKNIVNNTNCHNNNTNNFNLQFFLNEQCKDALNIEDFVNTIKLQLSDLDMIGRVGYTEGMSKIFIRNLKDLDIFKRPIHCSDLKRETMYVKDKDAWEKENGENVKIKQAIKGIENKNIKQLPQWRAENPAAEDTDTKKHLEYQHILIESMGGSTLEDDNKKHNKIVRNVAKEVVIDKTNN